MIIRLSERSGVCRVDEWSGTAYGVWMDEWCCGCVGCVEWWQCMCRSWLVAAADPVAQCGARQRSPH